MTKNRTYTGPYWTMREATAYIENPAYNSGFPKKRWYVYQGLMMEGQIIPSEEQLLGVCETPREGHALMIGLYTGAFQLSMDEQFFQDAAGFTLTGLATKVGVYTPHDFEDMNRQAQELAAISAEEIAEMADEGKDISHFFTNDGEMKPPVDEVIYEPQLTIPESRKIRAERVAVIKNDDTEAVVVYCYERAMSNELAYEVIIAEREEGSVHFRSHEVKTFDSEHEALEFAKKYAEEEESDE